MGKLFKGLLAGAALAWCGSAQAAIVLDLTAGQRAIIDFDDYESATLSWIEEGAAKYSAFAYMDIVEGGYGQYGSGYYRSYNSPEERWLGTSGYYTGPGSISFTMFAGEHLKITMDGFENPTVRYVDLPDIITGLPEPATWAMLLIGFGAIGATLRRRPYILRS